jgi:hypothetical protein
MSFIQTSLFKNIYIHNSETQTIKRIKNSTLLARSGFKMFAIFPLSDFLFNLGSLQGFELWLEHGAKKTRQFNLI